MGIMITNSEGWPGLSTAVRMYNEKRSAIDIVEQAIREVESEPEVHSVGRGSWPNAEGELELDACIVDGNQRRAGSIGALKGYLHPITVARSVMDNLLHVFLAGEGAARYAREIGAEQAELLTDVARKRYGEWVAQVAPKAIAERWPDVPLAEYAARALDPVDPLGTTVYLVLKDDGSIAAGVSTSGWAWKYPGRLGDSPVPGAGCYADSRYGAAACTGMGELALRSCASYSVVGAMRFGLSVSEACRKAAEDIVSLSPPAGAILTIHALSRDGDHHVLRIGPESGSPYLLWEDHMDEFAERKAAHCPLTQLSL
jgi:L-asparaginase / beta-aspartyl-peptidase